MRRSESLHLSRASATPEVGLEWAVLICCPFHLHAGWRTCRPSFRGRLCRGGVGDVSRETVGQMNQSYNGCPGASIRSMCSQAPRETPPSRWSLRYWAIRELLREQILGRGKSGLWEPPLLRALDLASFWELRGLCWVPATWWRGHASDVPGSGCRSHRRHFRSPAVLTMVTAEDMVRTLVATPEQALYVDPPCATGRPFHVKHCLAAIRSIGLPRARTSGTLWFLDVASNRCSDCIVTGSNCRVGERDPGGPE